MAEWRLAGIMRRSSWGPEVVTRRLKGRRRRWSPLKGPLECCWRGESWCLRAVILRRLSTRRRGLAVLTIFSVQSWRWSSLRWSRRLLCFVLPRGVSSPFVVNYRPQIHCSDKSVVPVTQRPRPPSSSVNSLVYNMSSLKFNHNCRSS
mgnify:CR=1 FL=1